MSLHILTYHVGELPIEAVAYGNKLSVDDVLLGFEEYAEEVIYDEESPVEEKKELLLEEGEEETPVEEAVYEEEQPLEEVYEEEPTVEENEELPAEEAVYDEPSIAEGWYKEDHPAEEAAGIAQLSDHLSEAAPGSVINASPADLAFYENWQGLTVKQKRKRTKELRARGLLTPSPDGTIPIFATRI